MQFHTPFLPIKTPGMISIHRPVLLLGSCFSDNILKRMERSLWNVMNPAGTLYNPLSIAAALRLLALEPIDSFRPSIFQASNGYHFSWMFDSYMFGWSEEELVSHFEFQKSITSSSLNSGATLIVTFGSAYCYFLKSNPNLDSNTPVGNCHKVASDHFELRLVESENFIEVWRNLIKDLKEKYPGIKIIFTISPVRYLSYGFAENSLSKSILRLTIYHLAKEFSNVCYFPAFEIMNDDLRDYRFYAADMNHPNDIAVDYIWDKFKATYLSADEIKLLDRGERLLKAWNHRPILPETLDDADIKYVDMRKRWDALRNDWPSVADPLWDSREPFGTAGRS